MTQTTSVYTAHDIPDLLNSLPTLFGFTPTESLVGLRHTVHGAGSASGCVSTFLPLSTWGSSPSSS